MLIDHVYRSVQNLLNKNSKGTLTPERFNELCRIAQHNIFMNLANEKRQYMNRKAARRGGTRKQEIDKALSRYLVSSTPTVTGGKFTLPSNFAFTPNKYLFYQNQEVSEIPTDNLVNYTTGITAPTDNYPQHRVIGQEIEVFPNTLTDLEFVYYRYPNIPNWTYITVSDVPIFNITDPSFVDVDIYEHRSEELIMEILVLAGLSIKEPTSMQTGMAYKQEDERNNATT